MTKIERSYNLIFLFYCMKFEEEKQMMANFSIPSLHTERHDQQELQKRHSEIHTMKKKC